MKDYMDLVALSGKKHRRQSRMTRWCILLAVSLIATIFGMADMSVRCQKEQVLKNSGGWHAGFGGLTESQEELLLAKPDLDAVSWYNVVNYGLDEGFLVDGTETVVCGMEQDLLQLFPAQQIVEGGFPETGQEAAVTKSMKTRLGLSVGSRIQVSLPGGQSRELTVCGFTGDTSMLTSKDAFGLFVSREGFEALAPGRGRRPRSL